MSARNRWIGDMFAWVGASDADSGADLTPGFSMNIPAIGNEDLIERLLVDYSFYTQIESSASGLEKMPEPWCVAVYYTPIPPADLDIETDSPLQAMIGDALYSALLHWVPTFIWTGTDWAVQWHASSNGVQSVKGKRRIIDKTTATVHFGINPLGLDVPGPGTQIPLSVSGFMRVKLSIQKF